MSTLRLAFVIGCAALLCTGSARAQDATFQEWFSLPMTYDVGNAELRPQLWTDLHVRRRADSTLFILRPAVGLRFNRTVAAHIGYAWVPTLQDGAAPDSQEHRAFEQVVLNFPQVPWMTWQLRTRFEQRFSSLGDDVALRLRQFVRVGFRFVPGEPYLFTVWDELFVGLTDADWGPATGYDQNRLFLGPGVDVPALGGRFELGYLWNNLNGPQAVQVHALFVQLVVAL